MKKVYDIPREHMKGNESIRRVYTEEEESPSLDTMNGGNREPKIAVEEAPSETLCLNSKVNGKQPSLSDRIYDDNGIMTACATAPFFMGQIKQTEESNMKKLTIRKLTEEECYRLMGFEAEDAKACKELGSQSAANLYHQAGDSIVTTVLCGILGELIGADYRPIIERYCDKLHGEVAE